MSDRGFDFAIPGAGTAGCLLANRLSADPAYLRCIGKPRTDWCYRTEPESGLGGRVRPSRRARRMAHQQTTSAMGDHAEHRQRQHASGA